MSKQKIDETMTEARNARAKRKVDEAMLPPIVPRAKRPKKAAAETKPPENRTTEGVPVAETAVAEAKPKARGRKAGTDEQAPKEELVVFAFRLKVHERDLIHKAAGAAKASRFVRALTVAASMGDEQTVVELVRAVKGELAAAS